ncbi:MAG: thiol peroxidase [Gammaproteobacteria bacterium]|nr:thiol peroxidase [Gammaproteobacteria bacterium]
MAAITLKGTAFSTNGELPAIGSSAPDFKLANAELNDKTLADFNAKNKLLNIVPSLDTDVCAASTKKFNDAANNHDDTVFLIISADLPFAQSRFCKNESLSNVITLSEMRNRNFAKDYGVLIQDGPLAGITARAIVILDENNTVIYTQLVTEITHEPDYEKALAALSK